MQQYEADVGYLHASYKMKTFLSSPQACVIKETTFT